MEIQTDDLILNLPNQDLRGLLVRKFRTNTHQGYASALYGGNKKPIKRCCRYSLIPYDNKSHIHVHNYPELLLTNMANFTFKCGSKNETVSGCRTCIYVLESGYSVIAEDIFISDQRTKISGHTNENVVNPLNLAIVKAMLDETSLNGVEAIRIVKSVPKLEIPSFKFYTHDLDKKGCRG